MGSKLVELNQAHQEAMKGETGEEAIRLHRLQRDWLRRLVQWSSELGKIRFGHFILQELLAQQCWSLSKIVVGHTKDMEDGDELMELKTDAVTHMALAEQPER